MVKPLCLGIFCCLFACARPAGAVDGGDGAGGDAAPLLSRIVAVQAAHAHVQGRYTYRNVPVGDPDTEGKTWTGRFAFARPDRFAVRLVEEGVEGYEAWRSDGESIWHIVALDSEGEPVVRRRPIGRARDRGLEWHRVGRFILLDEETVAADFAMSARELGPDDERLDPDGAAVYAVDLSPTSEAMRGELRGVTVQFGPELRPLAVRIHDAADNLLTAVIISADYESEIPSARFRWGR